MQIPCQEKLKGKNTVKRQVRPGFHSKKALKGEKIKRCKKN
jgi:hypothetical protein